MNRERSSSTNVINLVQRRESAQGSKLRAKRIIVAEAGSKQIFGPVIWSAICTDDTDEKKLKTLLYAMNPDPDRIKDIAEVGAKVSYLVDGDEISLFGVWPEQYNESVGRVGRRKFFH